MLTISDPRPLEALEARHAVAVPVHAHHVLIGGVRPQRGRVAPEVGGGRRSRRREPMRRVRVARRGGGGRRRDSSGGALGGSSGGGCRHRPVA